MGPLIAGMFIGVYFWSRILNLQSALMDVELLRLKLKYSDENTVKMGEVIKEALNG